MFSLTSEPKIHPKDTYESETRVCIIDPEDEWHTPESVPVRREKEKSDTVLTERDEERHPKNNLLAVVRVPFRSDKNDDITKVETLKIDQLEDEWHSSQLHHRKSEKSLSVSVHQLTTLKCRTMAMSRVWGPGDLRLPRRSVAYEILVERDFQRDRAAAELGVCEFRVAVFSVGSKPSHCNLS